MGRRSIALAGVPLLAAACAAVEPPGMDAEAPEGPQRVALALGGEAPRTNFSTFARSVPGGAAKGAAIGGGAALGGTMIFAAGPYGPFVVVLGAIAAVGTSAAGAVLGAQAAVPPEKAAEIERMLDDAVARLRAQERLAAEVAALAQRDAALAFRDRADAQSVLEVAVTEIGFETCGPEVQRRISLACPYDPKDPVVALYMHARARLLRAADGRELFSRTMRTASPRRHAAVWAAQDGARLVEAFELAYADLASRIVDEFILPPSVALRASTASGMLVGLTPGYGACWLVPLQPAHSPVLLSQAVTALVSLPKDHCRGSALRFPVVDSLQPQLAWEAFPRELDRGSLAPQALAAIREVRYDVRIWEVENCERGRLAYERVSLPEPSHRVETPLQPQARYYWSFRARFVLEGRPMAMRWASFDPVHCHPVDFSDWHYHRFATPPRSSAPN